MAITNNTSSNVSLGKPKVGGSIFTALKGTAVPTNATTALNAAFKNVGYISEDGLVNSNSPETEEIKAWGGDVVKNPLTAKSDTFKFTMIEALNVDALGVVYGSDNVSGTLAAGITVKANSKLAAPQAFVVEMVLDGNTLKRIVIPEGQLIEVGDITYVDDEVIGYEVTISALPTSGLDYDTHREYIQTAPTSGSNV